MVIMLDIKLIRENPEIVRKDLKKRGDVEKEKLLDELIEKDKQWRALVVETDKLKAERNKLSEEIGKAKKSGKDASAFLKQAATIPEKIKENDEKIFQLQQRCNGILMRVPNILHESVPIGKDDSENVEIKKWGKQPKFNFQPKDHFEILSDLGLIDAERAAKISGHGFFFFKNELAMLDYAIMQYAITFLRGKGFTVMEPPLMIQRKPYEGVTDLADFENVMYKIDGDDLYLIATSEHAMAGMFMNETIEKSKLPIKLCGISPCFRREVGAHGKYTKGLFRMHQFNKVEQFIFCLPEDSWKFHEELQKNSEKLYQGLGLHYRVVNVCTGDIGSIAAKKYDTEVWMADGKFREIGSNSNCTDYQARRLGIKWREKEGAAPAGFVHTLNNTALATSRTMVAIIEQYQRKDGTVEVPEVLRKYMNGRKIIGKK